MKLRQLPLKNLLRRPGRTAALVLLTAFLALSVFCGSVVVRSLQSGLDSLEARLGADIIVMPATAESKVSFKNMLLQGTTGAFSDCCAVKVQVIGLDPATDFTVKPWIDRSTSRALEEMDVAVGCDVTADVGEDLRIYGLNTHVVAKLAETGTGLDTAVYCTLETMKRLLAAAEEKGVGHKITSDTSDMISAVYVKVAEGYDVDAVNNALNGHVRKVTAVRARSMFTDVSDSLTGISKTVALLIGAVWVLAFVILLIAFAMMVNERRREFAVLRLLGASRRGLSRLMLAESALCSLAGGMIGVGVAALAVFPFATLIETRLGLPYLTPPAREILAMAAGTLLATLLVGALASAWSAWRLSRTDVGIALREGV